MGKLHFIGGEKGGVGKSFTARLLAQYFIDSNLPFHAFDTDRSHETLSRFYGDFSSHVDANDFDSLDQIIEYAEQNPHHQILVDLAAQTFTALTKWIKESDVFDLFSELDYQVYLWHVMDDGADSMFLLDKLLQAIPDSRLQVVVVENYGRGQDFEHFETSAVYQQAVNRGAQMLELSPIHPALMRKIDFNSFSFWAAANSKQAMTIAERKRVGVWLKKHYQLIENIMTPQTDSSAPEKPVDQLEPEMAH